MALCRFSGRWARYLANRTWASSCGPARPRAIGWEGAGAWVMASHLRQENFSRTCWITFHCAGTCSSVSVMSSPSLRRIPPQPAQAVGAGWITRSRGRCPGSGRRAGFRGCVSSSVTVVDCAGREINRLSPERRLVVRRERSKPLVDDFERWMRRERRKLSSKTALAEAMDYSLKRWTALTRFIDNGCICLSNNAAERAVRGIGVGRSNWTFAGSDSGGRRAAAIYTLIATCKLNEIDPRAWLADVLARLADPPAARVG